MLAVRNSHRSDRIHETLLNMIEGAESTSRPPRMFQTQHNKKGEAHLMAAELNPQTVGMWINHLHGSGLGRIHISSHVSWTGRLFDHTDIDGAVRYITELDGQGAPGIYLRCTTIKNDWQPDPSNPGARGDAASSASFPGMWSDIDLAGPGHKHKVNMPGVEGYEAGKKIRQPLPPTTEIALAILADAGIPTPTTVIHSGGGLYAWWILHQPLDLVNDEMELPYATGTSEAWQKMLEDAYTVAGYHYGNVGDLSRVLRIPGTVNRKIPEDPRPCVGIPAYRGGPRYEVAELDDVLANVGRGLAERAAEVRAQLDQAGRPSQPKLPKPATSSVGQWSSGATPAMISTAGDSPFDDFENHTTWDDILTPHGWTIHHHGHGNGVYWTRPGKNRRDGWSASTGMDPQRDRMFVFSDASDLDHEEAMTKPYVYAMLNHGGDLGKAAAALKAQGFGRQQPEPIRVEIVPPALPAVIPAAPEPAGDNPAMPVGDGSTAWPQPRSLEEIVKDPSPFPLHVLPEAVRDLATSISDVDQVDPELPALAMLSTISGVAAHRYEVGVWEMGWMEPPVVNTAVEMGSGERKTPPYKRVMKSIFRLMGRDKKANEERCEMEILEKGQDRGGGPFSGGPLANRLEEQIKKLDEDKKRPPRILVSSDTTAEALVGAMERNGGRGLILDAEAKIIDTLVAGRYGNGAPPNLGLILDGYDGNRYSSDRVGRGDQEIDRAILTVGVALQSVSMKNLIDSAYANDKGLTARFILARPKSRAGGRTIRGRQIPMFNESAQRRWDDLVERLWDEPICPETDGGDTTFKLLMSDEAKAMFFQFHDEHEVMLGENGPYGERGIREWANKYVGRCMRIAALFHLADGFNQAQEISAETMSRAIELSRWTLEQAIIMLKPIVEEKDHASMDNARQLLNALKRKGVHERRGVSVREVRERYTRAAWATVVKVTDALDILAEHGYVVKVTAPDRNNRPRDRYLLNPLA